MVEGGGTWDGEDIWGEGAARERRDESSIGVTLLCEKGGWRKEGRSREGGKRGGRMEGEGRRTEGRGEKYM